MPGIPRAVRLERIWKVVAAIPSGCVLSYGEVARRAGSGRGARQVAPALRAAPDELDLPWYRVVNARGEIAIHDEASAAEQRRRLLAEGIRMNGRRVAREHLDLPQDLDQLLWRERV